MASENSDCASLELSCEQPLASVCSVAFDDAIPGITVVWKCYVTSAQLRLIHEYILQLLRRHGVAAILADDSALPVILAEDQRWIAQDWMPRAQAAGLKVIASKRPEAYFGQLAIESVQAITPPGLEFRSFDRTEDGRAWLRKVCAMPASQP